MAKVGLTLKSALSLVIELTTRSALPWLVIVKEPVALLSTVTLPKEMLVVEKVISGAEG